jgi:hypothetical protein
MPLNKRRKTSGAQQIRDTQNFLTVWSNSFTFPAGKTHLSIE